MLAPTQEISAPFLAFIHACPSLSRLTVRPSLVGPVHDSVGQSISAVQADEVLVIPSGTHVRTNLRLGLPLGLLPVGMDVSVHELTGPHVLSPDPILVTVDAVLLTGMPMGGTKR